jgi:hypothetical protein
MSRSSKRSSPATARSSEAFSRLDRASLQLFRAFAARLVQFTNVAATLPG